MSEVKQAFRPEFLNRVDEMIVFHQLTEENIKEIAVKMLEQLTERLKDNNIEISFSDDAVAKIAKAGFDPVYGARPLRRAIQNQIEDKAAEEMLEGNIKPGDHAEVVVENDEFVFKKTE